MLIQALWQPGRPRTSTFGRAALENLADPHPLCCTCRLAAHRLVACSLPACNRQQRCSPATSFACSPQPCCQGFGCHIQRLCPNFDVRGVLLENLDGRLRNRCLRKTRPSVKPCCFCFVPPYPRISMLLGVFQETFRLRKKRPLCAQGTPRPG